MDNAMTMKNVSLDERCLELKTRLRSAQTIGEQAVMPPVSATGRKPSKSDVSVAGANSSPGPPSIEIRNPHPLVKAALTGMREVPEEYGKLQFRLKGHVDIRVTKMLVRRALTVMDTLFKRLHEAELEVQLQARDSSYHRIRRYTNVVKASERVQVTITEKTFQRQNPGLERT